MASNQSHVPQPHGDHQFAHNNDFFHPSNNLYAGYDPADIGASEPSSFDQNWPYSTAAYTANGSSIAATNSSNPAHDPLYSNDWHNPSLAAQQNAQDGFLDDSNFTQQPFGAPNPYNNAHPTLPVDYPTFPQQQAFSSNAFVNPSNVARPQPPPEFSNTPTQQPGTITPDALQSRPVPSAAATYDAIKYKSESPASDLPRSFAAIPNGKPNGKFSITAADEVKQATNARQVHTFLFIGGEPLDLSITKGTLPAYYPRKSRSEIRRLMKNDSTLSTSVAKKLSKKSGASGIKLVPSKIQPPGQTAVARRPSQSSSDYSSSDESDYESSEDEQDKSPLPATRPATAVGNTEYDTIKAVWGPRSRPLNATQIKEGLKGFWEVIQTIRDRWKSDSTAVKDAEVQNKVGELPLLKERVASQRVMLQTSLNAAIKHAHPDIIDHLRENLPLVHTIALFLNERAKELDYNGAFSHTMLNLLAMCKTLTTSILQETKISKILERFAKRGDGNTKVLVKRITDNGVAASKRKKEGKPVAGTTPVTSASLNKTSVESSVKSAAASLVGVKRPRTADGGSEQPTKKSATATNGAITMSNNKPAMTKPNPVSASSQSKPVSTAAKGNPFFSGLNVAKRPATSTPAGAPATKKPATAPPPEKKPAALKSGFSFAEAFASINKPKEPEPVKRSEATSPPETEEEKAKRLRKEARRKLKVTFKPDNALVDIRYFTHDPDEELGHDASQVRDVFDKNSEGRMFKFKSQHKDEIDLDIDDDEDTLSADLPRFSRPWPGVSDVDFNDISSEERERMYEPYGGGTLRPETPDRDIQIQRESGVLMVVYPSSDDIPPTPKEPSEDVSIVDKEAKSFGEVPETIIQRVDDFEKAQAAAIEAIVMQAGPNLAAILGAMNPTPTSAQIVPQQPAASSGPNELEKLLASFGQSSIQQQQPQQPQQQVQMPWLTDSNQPADALANLMNQMQQTQQAPNPFAANFGQPQQVQPSAVNPPLMDINAVLASLNQPNGVVSQPAAPPPPPQFSGASDLAQFLGSLQQPASAPTQTQVQQSAAYPFENEERRRMREQGGTDDDAANRSSGNAADKLPWNPNPIRGRNKEGKQVPMFVVPCKYWKEGKCRKGKDCTFLHDGPGGTGL